MADIIRAEGYVPALEAGEHLELNRPPLALLTAAFLGAGMFLWVLNSLHLASFAPGQAVSPAGALVAGLVAGTSSCLAVVGGLLLAVSAHLRQRADLPLSSRLLPLLQFNVGRLLSYAVFGGIIGWLGQSLGLSIGATGLLTLVIAIVMLGLGVSLLGLSTALPVLRLPKSVTRKIAALGDSQHPAAALLLGALTFFLPCGFTQSMQLVALASGSAQTGSLIMLAFAIGTLPALLGVSLLSTVSSPRWSLPLRTGAGALVVLLSLLNIQSGLALLGVNLPSSAGTSAMAVQAGSVQEVAMEVTPYGTYEPDHLTVKAGVPVRWVIDGRGVEGCTSVLVVPALGMRTALTTGTNVIEFTPKTPGKLAFSCGMGMVRGSFTVQ